MTTNTPALAALEARLAQITNLQSAAYVLGWDQATHLPPKGGPARGRQLATLEELTQERLSDPELGRLIARAEPKSEDERALVEKARRLHARATRIPVELAAQMAEHAALSFDAWQKARPKDDFAAVRPLLEKTVELSRRIADCFPERAHPMDALIDPADEGMTVATVRTLFTSLRKELVPIVKRIASCPQVDDAVLKQKFPIADQKTFAEWIVTRLGYDTDRGRIDLAPHPFMTRFGAGDVRITTRYAENDISDGLFSMIHEAGHALYELGIPERFDGNVLGGGASSGVHESQSRLWENMIGRSRSFWRFAYPVLQERFPSQLGHVPLETFYRAINKVAPSLIRTDADEVTYNLHVMIRFDFECALIEGTLAVKDLPEAWRARYQADLGVSSPGDSDGVLQDVHWFGGPVGGVFQGYTIGNVLAAQLMAAARKELPKLDDQIEAGTFAPLRHWLGDKLHAHGSMYLPDDLIVKATGKPLAIDDYVTYLTRKYAEIYG